MAIDSKSRRLLVVMAHPDDAEILVGGTLFHLKDLGLGVGDRHHDGRRLRLGHRGEGRDHADSLSPKRKPPPLTWALAMPALGLMDVEVIFTPPTSAGWWMSMRRFDPDVVITHSPVDYMLDHEEASRLARGATFAIAVPNYETRQTPPAPRGRATPALYYADPRRGRILWGSESIPQFYVDISKTLPQKREMLSRHVSQREWLRSHHGMDEYLEQMTAWAAGYGSECGFAYAEGLRQHLGHGYPQQHRPAALKPSAHGSKGNRLMVRPLAYGVIRQMGGGVSQVEGGVAPVLKTASAGSSPAPRSGWQ